MQKNKEIILRIIEIIFTIIYIFILAIIISIIVQEKTNDNKLPNIFGIKPIVYITQKEEKSIAEFILIKETDIDKLEDGIQIAYRNNENTIEIDEIYKIEKNEEETKIIIKEIDEERTIEEERIEGKIVGKIPQIGQFLMYIREPKGLIMTMLIIILIGLIWIFLGNTHE